MFFDLLYIYSGNVALFLLFNEKAVFMLTN